MLLPTKGVQRTKQAFRQHVVENQKSYPAILRQNMGVVLIRDPDPTTLTTPTLRPYTYDPTTLSTTPRPYPRPYDPEIAQLLFFAIHKIFIHSFCEAFLKVGKIQYFLY